MVVVTEGMAPFWRFVVSVTLKFKFMYHFRTPVFQSTPYRG